MLVPDSPTRRGALALGGGVLLGLAAGCEAGGRSDDAERTRPPRDPDATLLRETLQRTVDLQAFVVAAAALERLVVPLQPLRAMHEAHLAVLLGAGRQEAPAATVPTLPRGARRVLAAVREAESAYAPSLALGARSARSGPFARLLASMAAGVDQHLAALPADAVR